MCNQSALNPGGNACGPGANTYQKVGRLGSRDHQLITVWSSLLFDTENRVELMDDQLEIYLRGENDAARPPLSSFPDHPTDQSRQFRNEENYWMVEYPKAYLIPLGDEQRSDVEAVRLVRWLLLNGIEVHALRGGGDDDDDDDDDDGGGSRSNHGEGYVVWMDQPHRGLAFTALDVGLNVSDRIGVLYAPPGAWSHGELWGADVVRIEDSDDFDPRTRPIERVRTPEGDVEGRRNASRFAMELDSPTAVRTLNALLADGLTAEVATAPFTNVFGDQLPAGTVLFPTSARRDLEEAAEDSGLNFTGVSTLPAREPIDRSPRIAVLTGALTQEIWVLRQLGFTADPVSTGTINSAPTDPLANYDVIFNQGNWPGATQTTARTRLTAFFANGGGYIGAGVGGANFLTAGAQVAGLTPATMTSNETRSVRGWSGIIAWDNHHSRTGQITGAYPNEDRAIVDPPVWFTGLPASWTADGSLPMMGFFLSGLWKTDDPQAVTAPGAPVIAHGLNTAGSSRMTAFAMNPAYRADPEREWPMLASAALWSDQ
jgi:hypothetical protein